MATLKRVCVWLSRCHHCRGFGIQSPWAYRLVRYVVNEHAPYYAYDELAPKDIQRSADARRLHRLYFRLANYRQPGRILNFCPETTDDLRYMQRGCQRAEVLTTSDARQLPDNVSMARLSLTGNYEQAFSHLVAHADNRLLVVLQDIYRDKQTHAFWQKVVADNRCITTFDLYYCGLVFFNSKRFKEHYIINF